MTGIDRFLPRVYDPANYNCAHFVCEVWEAETGQPIGEALAGFLAPRSARVADMRQRSKFTRLERPKSPCLVLMDRPKLAPHVGMYLRGKVLHIQEKGVQYMPLPIATYGYKSVRFYEYANRNNC